MITRRTGYRIAAMGVAAGVLVVSSWPALSFSPLHWSYEDKLQHMIAYTLLSYLATRGWVPDRGMRWSHGAAWTLILVLIGFAAIEEYHQRWIPGRFVELADWLADTLGILIGFFFGRWHNARTLRRDLGRGAATSASAHPEH